MDVSLTLPPGWWELPLVDDPRARRAAIVSMVTGWVAGNSLLRPRAAVIVDLLDTVAASARRAGVLLAAQFALVGSDGLASANVTMAVQDLAPGLDPLAGLERTVDAVDLQLGPPLEEPVRVRLPNAPDARRQTSLGAHPELGVTARVVEYQVPLPGAKRSAVVITFTAPNPGEFDRDTVRVCDMVAASLRVDREGVSAAHG